MRNKKIYAVVLAVMIVFAGAAYPHGFALGNVPAHAAGQIYLYGEQHGREAILEKEFELWYDYYHNDGMRHLFIEYAYYTAEFMNIWMQSDSDDILNTIYDEWTGTAGQVPVVKEFYRKIKTACPETVFHGTDVGHQYDTTGQRFLAYLEQNGLDASAHYSLAWESIEQGLYYYKNDADAYRENKLAENFINAYDSLDGENVMGIYGRAHTGLDAMDLTGVVPCMANQLKEYYVDRVHSEDLSWIRSEMEPSGAGAMEVAGKRYVASYFGQQDLTGFKDYTYREYWRLEDAYDDFKDNPKTGDVLPYSNYPLSIETGQVFVIDYTKTDGSVTRMYYRSDGNEWNGSPATEEFLVR